MKRFGFEMFLSLILGAFVAQNASSEPVPVEGCPAARYNVEIKLGNCRKIEEDLAAAKARRKTEGAATIDNTNILAKIPGHAGIYDFVSSSIVETSEACKSDDAEKCVPVRKVRVCHYQGYRWATHTPKAGGGVDISGAWIERDAPKLTLTFDLNEDGSLASAKSTQTVLSVASRFPGQELCQKVEASSDIP